MILATSHRRAVTTGRLLLLLGALAVVGCSKKVTVDADPTPSAAPRASGAPGPGEMADVDTFAKVDFQKVACSSSVGVACRIAKDFAKAGPFHDWPKGKAVYYGKQVELTSRGEHSTRYFFVHIEPGRGAPDPFMSKLAPGVLTDFRGGWHETKPSNQAESAEATTLFETLAKGEPAPPSSVATWARNTAPLGGMHTIARTHGASHFLSTDGASNGFFRQDGRRLLVMTWDRGDQDVEYVGYAEVWPI